MWLPEDEDPRERSSRSRAGSADALSYLARYRMTLELKCQGLDAEQLARRSVPPSTMSLLGLVRHLAGVEHSWYRRALQGRRPAAARVRRRTTSTADFNGAVATDECVEEAWAAWRARSPTRRPGSAGERLRPAGAGPRHRSVEVRDIVVHLIEEYARHVGHADLLPGVHRRASGAVVGYSTYMTSRPSQRARSSISAATAPGSPTASRSPRARGPRAARPRPARRSRPASRPAGRRAGSAARSSPRPAARRACTSPAGSRSRRAGRAACGP